MFPYQLVWHQKYHEVGHMADQESQTLVRLWQKENGRRTLRVSSLEGWGYFSHGANPVFAPWIKGEKKLAEMPVIHNPYAFDHMGYQLVIGGALQQDQTVKIYHYAHPKSEDRDICLTTEKKYYEKGCPYIDTDDNSLSSQWLRSAITNDELISRIKKKNDNDDPDEPPLLWGDRNPRISPDFFDP